MRRGMSARRWHGTGGTWTGGSEQGETAPGERFPRSFAGRPAMQGKGAGGVPLFFREREPMARRRAPSAWPRRGKAAPVSSCSSRGQGRPFSCLPAAFREGAFMQSVRRPWTPRKKWRILNHDYFETQACCCAVRPGMLRPDALSFRRRARGHGVASEKGMAALQRRAGGLSSAYMPYADALRTPVRGQGALKKALLPGARGMVTLGNGIPPAFRPPSSRPRGSVLWKNILRLSNLP